MLKHGDLGVLVFLIIGLICWLLIVFRQWLYAPPKLRLPIDWHGAPPEGEAVDLLEYSGYEVLSGKQKLPISIDVDGSTLESRLFIDFFAKKEEELYIVKVARARRPLEMTGSAIRDRLLPYALLYDEITGVLYVDVANRQIRQITFDIER